MAEMFNQLLDELSRIGRATGEEPLGPIAVTARLGIALVVGIVLGAVYSKTHTGKQFRFGIAQSLVMLCLGGALIWLVVGDNLVRAFGLAGTIGLIRYRTIVRDPKDTTVLLFAMVIGMACGLGSFSVALIGTGFVAVTLFLMHRLQLYRPPPGAGGDEDIMDLMGVPPESGGDKAGPPQKKG